MREKIRVALYMDIRSDYEHGIARGVIDFARARGDWQLSGHGWTLDEVRDIAHWRGRGIIAIIKSREEAQLLERTGLPVVDVAGGVPCPGITCVTNDDNAAGEIAGEHLRSCGLARFAFCGVAQRLWSQQRQDGFRRGCGCAPATLNVFEKPLDWWERRGNPPELRSFLRGLEHPTGIMAANDTIGARLTRCARTLGLRIPEDIAVVGVDNEDLLCELSTPSLSSIPCDCRRIGRTAAELLQARLEGASVPGVPRLIPPLPLIERESSGAAVCPDGVVGGALQFIRERMRLGINVEDVVKAAPVGRRSLELRFRKILRRSIREEIERARLDLARRMLLNPELAAGKIALACGFSSAQSFHAVFRRACGITPQAWRERYR